MYKIYPHAAQSSGISVRGENMSLNFPELNILRFLKITLFFSLLFLMIPRSVSAQDFYITDGILMQYDGSGGNITLPSEVQKVGGSAFRDNEDVTDVTIPEGCFAIEDGAFDGCINLRTISLPSTLDSIGTLAFARCKSLEYVNLPPNLEELKEGAFFDCGTIGAITIPANVSEIGKGCFSCCKNLSIITVDGGNKNFLAEDNVLFSSDGRTLVQYPAGRPDRSYSVPEGVETIGADSFDKAKNLREISFPHTLKKIRVQAFSGCTGLTVIDLPESVEMVEEYAFRNCTNLCRVYVRNKDQGTKARAFESDSSLMLYVPKNSKIKEHADKYNLHYRFLDDDVYDYPDPEMKF